MKATLRWPLLFIKFLLSFGQDLIQEINKTSNSETTEKHKHSFLISFLNKTLFIRLVLLDTQHLKKSLRHGLLAFKKEKARILLFSKWVALRFLQATLLYSNVKSANRSIEEFFNTIKEDLPVPHDGNQPYTVIKSWKLRSIGSFQIKTLN